MVVERDTAEGEGRLEGAAKHIRAAAHSCASAVGHSRQPGPHARLALDGAARNSSGKPADDAAGTGVIDAGRADALGRRRRRRVLDVHALDAPRAVADASQVPEALGLLDVPGTVDCRRAQAARMSTATLETRYSSGDGNAPQRATTHPSAGAGAVHSTHPHSRSPSPSSSGPRSSAAGVHDAGGKSAAAMRTSVGEAEGGRTADDGTCATSTRSIGTPVSASAGRRASQHRACVGRCLESKENAPSEPIAHPLASAGPATRHAQLMPNAIIGSAASSARRFSSAVGATSVGGRTL